MSVWLVTGGAGFIGSHLVDYLLEHYPQTQVVTLDKLTYAGSLDNLSSTLENPNHTFIQGDIADKNLIASLFSEYRFDGVFHLAAESHVDNSISGPEVFIQTNVVGTFNLLEAAKQASRTKPVRFLHVSTDEVYGSLGVDGYFTEQSPYRPNSPYSASKASSDMLVRSYHKTYGLDTVITNCSNNFGPRQHSEKLIPTVIRNALAGNPIPIYGMGTNVRDWLYVSDHCSALDKVFQAGKSGEVYNIGTHNELNNIELVRRLCQVMDELMPTHKPYEQLIQFVADRPGHDYRYAIDPSKIQNLGWQPKSTFESHLAKTVSWYLQAQASQAFA